eukprot:m.315741 g.315741  ORF g.315741 m.315741 type:complete len:88 (+) comp753410_c0_seq1:53-316(+)
MIERKVQSEDRPSQHPVVLLGRHVKKQHLGKKKATQTLVIYVLPVILPLHISERFRVGVWGPQASSAAALQRHWWNCLRNLFLTFGR